MSVKPRGKSWQAYVSIGSVKHRKSFSTVEEATLWEAQVRHAEKVGLPIDTYACHDLPLGLTLIVPPAS
jgi:hypothetical protein